MPKSTRTALVVGLLLVVPVALAPAAAADGVPLDADASTSGVVSSTGGTRYVAAAAGRHTAVVAQDAASGAVRSTALLRGTFGVPQVAGDGTPAGISADGTTLVLIRPRTRFPRAYTGFAVMETKSRGGAGLRLRSTLRLKGDFSFDALSADGASIFLIQYISPRDASKYRVRVYDLRRGRLAPKPIVDPRERPDEMNGFPLARAASPDGRWAYTLYDGLGEHPFIHALDTSARRAVCIDLPHGALGQDPYAVSLDVGRGGRSVAVLSKRRTVALLDTRTFRVSRPARARSARDGGAPWLPIALLTCLVGSAALVIRRRKRRSAAAAAAVWSPPVEPEGDSPEALEAEPLARR